MNDAETGQVLEMDDCEPDSDSENGDYFLLQNFNQPETETAISEEIAKQIELESDKNNLAEELGGEVEKEILQEDAINTNKCEDNKISQKSLENISENCEDSQTRETKTDFGISLGILKVCAQHIQLRLPKKTFKLTLRNNNLINS